MSSYAARLILLALSLVALAACGTHEVGRPDGSGGSPDGGVTCTGTVDSDGDGLFDSYEGTLDTDGDGTADSADLDSDGDGLLDAEESGGLGGCNALNSDGDGVPDYRDNDSDNDGLSDMEEVAAGTMVRDADSDHDGFTDTAEVATGHDPNDAMDGIPADDYYVVLPYLGDQQFRDLTFSTDVQKADVFFMMDRTGSMTEEEAQLRSGLSALVTRITSTIPDIGVGFGGFADFPVGHCTTLLGIETCDYGAVGDTPFSLISTITTDTAQMLSDVSRLHADQGGANWASSGEALYQAATGEGIGPWVPPQSCPSIPDDPAPRRGYPCFRAGALPIIVTLTDTSARSGPLVDPGNQYDASQFMGFPPHTYEQTLAQLQALGARTFGVISGTEITTPVPAAQFRQWAVDTGTVDGTGAPIFFMIGSDGSGLTDSVATAIEHLARETPMNISTVQRDGADIPVHTPPVDATLFIKAVTPTTALDRAGTDITASLTLDDTTFYGVAPGGTVTFRIRFLNDFQMPALTSQVFRATIVVVGNGVAELDSHEVVIVVPAGSTILH